MNLGKVTTIFTGGVKIGVWIDAIANVSSSAGNYLIVDLVTGECDLNRSGSVRLCCDACYSQACGLARAISSHYQTNCYTNHSETRSGMMHFLVSVTEAPLRLGDANLAQYLAWLEGCC